MDADPRELSADVIPPPGSFTTSIFAPLDRVRLVAILAVVATVVGRGIAPAVRGVIEGPWVDLLGLLGGFLTQLLLFSLVWLLLGTALSVLQLRSLPLTHRLVATSFAGIVLGFATPTAVTHLPPEFAAILAVAASVGAIIGAAQALSAPETRAVGILLGLSALGCFTRQAAWVLALYGGAHASLRIAMGGRWVATGAMLLVATSTAVALLWIATRRWWAGASTMVATTLAGVVAWLAARGEVPGATTVPLVVARAIDRLLMAPAPVVPFAVRAFSAAGAIFLGAMALALPERTAVTGSLALVLLVGADADVPLLALSLAVASLAAALAAHDPRPETPRS